MNQLLEPEQDQESVPRYLGYARASETANLISQLFDLELAGCNRLVSEQTKNNWRNRPELTRLLSELGPGDVLTVTKLDRLARSTRELLEIAERIHISGAGLRSLSEPWADTTTENGLAVLAVFAGIVEFERSLILERTKDGREAAKARGVKFGAKPTLTNEQIDEAKRLIGQEGQSVEQAAKALNVHRSTLYRALRRVEK
ncbi:recombinase family protein [Pseudomonas sp. PDM11]|uniref:recombinase family protein n=1 Tax=Pseudomonas sp. PDM11 TaxID=2769309 RepID=UPI00177EF46F|nr:recombinase family protein [Pseudomonas sp. PDM11]MBD9397205.1 recombinase family protein [Pseudomonas sp. PDM11]